MGCYDTVILTCPQCSYPYYAQSKGGLCNLDTFESDSVPLDVASDVNRHAPFTCEVCGTVFQADVPDVKTTIAVRTRRVTK